MLNTCSHIVMVAGKSKIEVNPSSPNSREGEKMAMIDAA